MKSTAPPSGHEIHIYESQAALIENAAGHLVSELAKGGSHPRLVLAGGRTPVALYKRMSVPPLRDRIVWPQVRFTFTDERAFPPDHAQSNYRMAKEALFDLVGVPAKRVTRIRGEDPVERAAEKAHRELLEWAERVPLFDVVLLGVGEDGHVASLFPAESWPDFGTRMAAATRHPAGADRVSLTPTALCSTRKTLFLVSGWSKATAVARALTAAEASPQFPSRMVVSETGGAIWLLDGEAARELPQTWRRPT